MCVRVSGLVNLWRLSSPTFLNQGSFRRHGFARFLLHHGAARFTVLQDALSASQLDRMSLVQAQLVRAR